MDQMKTTVLWALAVYYLLTGLYIAILPMTFYTTAPGVVDTGPYNMHFVRDVGYAFIVSALGLGYGLHKRLKPVLVFGAAWLAAHGLFHLVLWALHHNPTSSVALIDLLLVVAPAALLVYLVIRFPGKSTAE